MAKSDADLEIGIKTTSDGSGAQQARKDIEGVKKEARSLGQAYKEAGGGLKGLGAAGKQAAELYNNAGGGLKGVFSVLAGGGAKAAAVIGTLTAALVGAKKALVEFGMAEQSVRGLQAALAQNGFLTKEVNDRYQELASTLQDLTGRADEEWIDVLKRLTQFGATPQDIERHVNAVKNLAGIMGGDLNGAAAAVAKAMEGEFHAFTRLGIQIDEHSTKTEKLNELYKQLAQKGAGQLEAAAESVNGQFSKFKNTLSDLFESIGQRISDAGVVQYVLYGLGTTVGWLAKSIGAVIPVADGMRNALKKSTDATIDAERYNKQYSESLKETAQWADHVADALQRQNDIKKAARQADDEAIDAKMAFDLALVDRQELLGTQGKQGGVSKEEAIRRRATIRSAAGARKFRNAQDARTEEQLTAQAQIENNTEEIKKAEDLAREAEAAIVSEEEVAKKRAALKALLDEEVEHWEANWKALHASPWDYENRSIGERAGPRTESDMARAGSKITARILDARARRDAEMGEFDKTMPLTVSGSRDRANEARNKAIETFQKNYAKNTALTFAIQALGAEKAAAGKTYEMQARTAAVTAGSELLTQNAAARPNQIQDQVVQASGAFPGAVSNLGASVDENSTAFNQVMTEALKSFREQNTLYRGTSEEFKQLRQEVKELQNQFKHRRNP